MPELPQPMDSEALSSGLRVQEFIELSLRNFGKLLPVRKLSPRDEKMFVGLRYFSIPSESFSLKEWYGARGMLLIDIIAEDDGIKTKLKPVGRMDLTIERDNQVTIQSSNRNLVISNEKWSALADEYWYAQIPRTDGGIRIDDEYRKSGIGTFITALSLFILDRLGLEEIQVKHLINDGSVGIWRRFGVIEKTEPYVIKNILTHPGVNQIIAEFI